MRGRKHTKPFDEADELCVPRQDRLVCVVVPVSGRRPFRTKTNMSAFEYRSVLTGQVEQSNRHRKPAHVISPVCTVLFSLPAL